MGRYITVIKPLVKGLLTYIPGMMKILPKGKGGSTNSVPIAMRCG